MKKKLEKRVAKAAAGHWTTATTADGPILRPMKTAEPGQILKLGKFFHHVHNVYAKNNIRSPHQLVNIDELYLRIDAGQELGGGPDSLC